MTLYASFARFGIFFVEKTNKKLDDNVLTFTQFTICCQKIGDTKNFRKKRQIRDFFRSLLPQFDLFLCFDVTDQGTNQSKQNMKPWPDLNCHIRRIA